MNQLDTTPSPINDPNLRNQATVRHQSLAQGHLKLPNLIVRSAFTIFLLYSLLTLVLITVVEFGYLSANLALILGVSFGVLQFIIGPWMMDLSLRWVYTMNWVQPQDLPEHLRTFVTRVCSEQGMKFPHFGVIEDGAPQAFTYGHHPNNARIVLSQGTMELLTPEELEGVVAHEIGHARNWDMALMTIVNLVPLLLYYLYRGLTRLNRGDKDKGLPWYITTGAYVLYIVSEYIVLWFSRTREFYADRFAGKVTGNPNALATALIKIAYGLAAQETPVGAETSKRRAGNQKDEMITLNLSGNQSPSAWSSKPDKTEKKENREIVGAGALAALNIFDRKAAVSMVLGSANQFTTSANSALDPEQVKSAMQWDKWNPWARWYELHSTHPLVARRLEYLSDQAAALGQEPLIVFDRMQLESYWDEFAVDLFLLCAPFLGALAGVGYAYWNNAFQGEWHWTSLGLAVALFGLGLLVKNIFRYRRDDFGAKTVTELLSEVKVSPVRPVPATVTGTIIGKGVPGLIYSEDFVLRDNTGILMLDYQQPLAIWNFLFGLLRADTYQGAQVRVTGWFRRAPVPYFEILRLETLSDNETRTCYSSYASFALSVVLMIAGVIMFLR